MSVTVLCEECGATRSVQDSWANRTVTCRSCGGKMRASADDDDDGIARRKARRRRSYAQSSSDEGGFGVPEIMYLVAIVLAVGIGVALGRWQAAVGGAFIAGMLLMTVGFYGAVVVAREAETLERICYIFVPIYHFFFWAKFWDDTKRYVACYGVGFATICVSMTILVTLAVQQQRRREQIDLAARQQVNEAMRAQANQFHEDHRRQVQDALNSMPRAPNFGPTNPPQIPGMGEPPSNRKLFDDINSQIQAGQQRDLDMARRQAEASRQRFGLPPMPNNNDPQQQQQAAKSEPKPADILREMSQPIALQRLLQISRQVKGKFEPSVGMQLFVKRADGEWYLAEVTEVLGPQKAQVRFAYDRNAADGVVGRDKVRFPNGPWPPFPEVTTDLAPEATPVMN